MLVFKLALVLSVSQIMASTPLAWEFKELAAPRDSIYSTLNKFHYTKGMEPIHFPLNDPSIDYHSQTWRDPCYQRFLDNEDSKFVVYWLIDKETYCEVYFYNYGNPTESGVTFDVDYLMRVEIAGQQCPHIPRD